MDTSLFMLLLTEWHNCSLQASDNLVTLLKKENITHTGLMFETTPTDVIRQIKVNICLTLTHSIVDKFSLLVFFIIQIMFCILFISTLSLLYYILFTQPPVVFVCTHLSYLQSLTEHTHAHTLLTRVGY